jgi:hypothetical protein
MTNGGGGMVLPSLPHAGMIEDPYSYYQQPFPQLQLHHVQQHHGGRQSMAVHPYHQQQQQQQAPYIPPADYLVPTSMLEDPRLPVDAVECRGLMKAYGHGKGKTKALNNVNMNVEQGTM